jgi:CBS domain-containing protein
MNLMKIAHVPPVVVPLSASVSQAVKAMVDNGVGAVAVVEGGVLRGIFSERDVIKKVVYTGGAPEQTSVADVMTTEVESIAADTPAPEALQLMVDGHFRHLPIVDSEGKVLGILSIRNFLQNRVEELEDSINSITSYYGADGSGG